MIKFSIFNFQFSKYLKLQTERGQILVGFLLVVVIGMTLTLSLISRTTTDIRLTSTTEQSSRAYNAAEAGIEEALKKIETKQITASPSAFVQSGSLGQGTPATAADYTYSVKELGTSPGAFIFPDPLLADQVAQIWLVDKNLNPVYTSQKIRVLWGEQGTPALNTPSSGKLPITPGMEVTVVYKNKVSGLLGDQKWYFLPSSSGFGTEVSTSAQTIAANTNNLKVDKTLAFSVQDGGEQGIDLRKIDLASNHPLLIRFRFLYNKDKAHTLAVWPLSYGVGVFIDLPGQGVEIESVGKTTFGASRKIKVFKSHPKEDSLFDFALFSGSTQGALKK